MLEKNVKGEQCAISTYRSQMNLTMGKDPVMCNNVLQTLRDEVEHEESLQVEVEAVEPLLTSRRK